MISLNSVMQELNCTICKNIMEDASEVSCCGSTFCEDCIAIWLTSNNSCPSCRRVLTMSECRPNRAIQKIISNLPDKCKYDCGSCINRGIRKEHETKCLLAEETCITCGSKVIRNGMEQHLLKEASSHIISLNNSVKELKEILINFTSNVVDGKYPSSIPLKMVLKMISQNPYDMESLIGDVEKRKKAIRALMIEFGTTIEYDTTFWNRVSFIVQRSLIGEFKEDPFIITVSLSLNFPKKSPTLTMNTIGETSPRGINITFQESWNPIMSSPEFASYIRRSLNSSILSNFPVIPLAPQRHPF